MIRPEEHVVLDRVVDVTVEVDDACDVAHPVDEQQQNLWPLNDAEHVELFAVEGITHPP